MGELNLFNHKYDAVKGLRGFALPSDVTVKDAITLEFIRTEPSTFFKYPTYRNRKKEKVNAT